MRRAGKVARYVTAISLCFVALAATGCEWSGDSEPDPSIMFENAIDFYGSSRANGEHAQKLLVSDPKTAAQAWGRSRRFAQFISDGEWSTPEQADFLKDLKGLLLSWNSANYRALEAARVDDIDRMRVNLRQAKEWETQIDDLLTTSDIENITDREFSGADFTREWRRDVSRLGKRAP